MGRITLQQYLAAKEKGNKTESAEGNGGGASGPEMSQIQAIFAKPDQNRLPRVLRS